MSEQPWQLESIEIMQSDKTTLRYVPESRAVDAFRAGAEAMREAAAQSVDCGCGVRAVMLAEPNENSAFRWVTCRESNCAAINARDIRNLQIPEMK